MLMGHAYDFHVLETSPGLTKGIRCYWHPCLKASGASVCDKSVTTIFIYIIAINVHIIINASMYIFTVIGYVKNL
jgi:hypothetical protein